MSPILTALLLLAACYAASAQQGPYIERCVYFITNDASANQVVAVPINLNTGMLMPDNRTLTPTGGQGRSSTFFGQQPPQDTLQSTNSVIVYGNMLFTLDAGSNRVVMFMIHTDDCTRLDRVGPAMNSMGEFPVSLAYTPRRSLLCVVNGGAVDGVACFNVNPTTGLSYMDSLARPLRLGQTSPPDGPFSTVSTMLWNDKGSLLTVFVKGNPQAGLPGRAYMWRVLYTGRLQADYAMVPLQTLLPFGATYYDSKNVAVADVGGFLGPPASGDDLQLYVTDQYARSMSLYTDSNGNTGSLDLEFAVGAWPMYNPYNGLIYMTGSWALGTMAQTSQIVELAPWMMTDANYQLFNMSTVDGLGGIMDITMGNQLLFSISPATNRLVSVDITRPLNPIRSTMTLKDVAAGIVPDRSVGMAVYIDPSASAGQYPST